MSEKASRILRALLGILVLAGIGAGVYFGFRKKVPPPKRTDAIQARLELAAGPVLVSTPGEAGGDGVRAASGAPLREGATIQAGDGARALIRLPDGSSVFLRAGTTVKLVPTGIDLEQGEYWLDAPPADREPLVHRAGDVTLSAADAGLSMKRTSDGAVVYVARGMAILSAKGGRVEVNSGEQATVKGGDKPAVAPVAFWDDWTGGMADAVGAASLGAGSGTIYGVDVGAAPGTAATKLQIKSQTVRAVVRGGLSETSVDQTFFNPSPRPVEGWYWFTVPEGASVTGFAVETNGVLVEGEFIEQREAAQKYVAARSSGFSPAILEWVDGRSYRARIFPVPASNTRRVVLRYVELRPVTDGKLSYVYPLGRAGARIGELSFSVDLGDEGKKMKIATVADARVEQDGRVITMRRSGYTPRADFQLEATLPEQKPALTLARFESRDNSADYVMARYVPDVDWAKVRTMPAEVVVVVDTSAAGDEAAQQLNKSAAEAILRSLSGSDKFALLALDVRPRMLYPDKGLAAASEAEIAKALEKLAGTPPGGATDIAAMFDPALERLHASEQPAVIYVGDGIATSGEVTGEQLSEHLRRALSSSRARLFTVAVGADADHAVLGELARTGGGTVYRIDAARQTTPVALELTAAIKAPTITNFSIDLGAGLDEAFVSASGKVSRGSEVVVLARTHHDIADEVKIKGRLGGEDFERKVKVTRDKGVIGSFVPRLWAAEYVRRLMGGAGGPEAERGRIVALGIDYGIVTPFTSILALENEQAYSRMNIQRKAMPLRGVRLGALSQEDEKRLAMSFEQAPANVGFACNKAESGAAPSSDEKVAAAQPQEAGEGSKAKGDDGVASPEPASPGAAATSAPQDSLGRGASGKGKEEEADTDGDTRDRKEDEPVAVASAAAASPPAMRPAPPPAPRGGLAAPASKTIADAAKLDKAAQEQSGKFGRDEQSERRGWAQPIAQATCSDVAGRPLEQRMAVWRKRLKPAKAAAELLAAYQGATRACELADWQAEREFLRLMQEKIQNEADARTVLSSLSSRRDVQKFVAKLIMRRATDPRVVGAVEKVLFGGTIDWNKVDLELAEIEDLDKRLAKLREVMAKAEGDPNGDVRLVKLLVRAGKSDEALAVGRRLRDHGLLTVATARQLGDVLARAKLEDEAIRTYSEIVEFDPTNMASRQLLGDTYLARGWYSPAYRQYKTATETAPNEPLAWLRLAAAAAGTGRVDEALRLERQVATAQGRPGPDDPRRWARMWSAARLARLVAKPPAGESTAAIERKLKELQLFSGPGTLVIVTWEDLSSDALVVPMLGKDPVALGETIDAAPIGLSALSLPPADAARMSLVARLRSAPGDEPLKLYRHTIAWNGTRFEISVATVELATGSTTASL